MNLNRFRWVVLTFVVAALALGTAPAANAGPQVGPVIGFAEPDLVNPLRGQHENLRTALFPQANSAQSSYPNWSGTFDMSIRLEWSKLQPKDPRKLTSSTPDSTRFDFSAIDNALAEAEAKGRRIGFRVTAFNSCCASSYPGNVNSSVPAWLRTISGATTKHTKDGVTHVVPNWNSTSYLGYFEKLLAALGNRYNKDDRVAWFEFSGYGDFSENHNSFMRTALGNPGPSEAESVQKLGYSSRYGDQYITKKSITRLVEATIKAFKDTRIVTAPGNPEIIRQLFSTSPSLSALAHPVGLRADCLGTYSTIPSWATDLGSAYVKSGDALVAVVKEQWKKAPVITEWCNFIKSGTVREYYERALREVVNGHVSVMSSTGFPDQRATTLMDAANFDLWARANKFSGFRYAVTDVAMSDSVTAGSSLPVTFKWTNFGSAPAYDKWQITYQIRDAAGEIVQSINSGVNLGAVYAAQNYSDTGAEPAARTIGDAITLGTTAFPAGDYTIHVRVLWKGNKSGAANPVSMRPMALAQQGRDGTGAYRVGTFRVVPNGPTA